MPRRTSTPSPEPPLYLAVPREEAAAKILARIQLGNELRARPIASDDQYREVQDAYFTWDEYNEEMLRQIFTSPKMAEEYRGIVFGGGGIRGLFEKVEELRRDVGDKARRLESIKDRLELIQLAVGVQSSPRAGVTSSVPTSSTKVFVVHGHDEGAREAVARLLTVFELEPIILHEQASEGRTLVEKLEHHGDVNFAVVLLTPDDVGGTDADSLRPRARQNVVFELGYFIARLTRNRVCPLYRGEVELPSDYAGVVYVPMDSSGAWRYSLARELRAAGFSIDMNKL